MEPGRGVTAGAIQPLILSVRGQRVIVDGELARLYGVATKALNQAVKRNRDRFPDDFAFQLTPAEAAQLRSMQAGQASQAYDAERKSGNRSQIVTGSQKHRDRRSRP